MAVRCIVCENTGLRIFCEKILRHFAGESLGFFLWKAPKMLTMCFAPNSASAHLHGKLHYKCVCLVKIAGCGTQAKIKGEPVTG